MLVPSVQEIALKLSALCWDKRRQADFAPHAADGLLPGRVVGEHRTHHQVAIEGPEVSATLAGRLRNAAAQVTDLPGVGDFVALRPSAGDGHSTIEAVLPRTSALVRKASSEQRPQLIAANVDIVFVVMALDGDFNPARLERYLTLIKAGGARPVVIANKTDKAPDAKAKVAALADIAIDCPIHAMSARAPGAAEVLHQYCDAATTVALIGSSGAGKSTLTNLLLERAAQKTGDVRGHDDRGRHTTTHRQMFVLPRGGAIMDTPGMRGLEVWTGEESTEPDVSVIDELALSCRFRNCGHSTEPGCAVRAAVERGEVAPELVARHAAKRAAAVPRWAR